MSPTPTETTPDRTTPLVEMDVSMPPHPVIDGYYQSAADRPEAVRELFDASAPAYDRITGLMSFGTGAKYRRDVLKRIGVGPGATVLDLACGTGQVSAAAVKLVGETGSVIGVDPSPEMRGVAAKRRGITVKAGTAESIPADDASVDFVTMGYALRHVSDLVVAFREMHRVLKPGGTVCALEITPPKRAVSRAALKFYLKSIIPPMSFVVSANRQASKLMSYYWDTIEQCVPPERILTAMERAGFETPTQSVSVGIFREYIGQRSA